MSQHLPVARLDQLTAGRGLAVEVGRTTVALFCVGGEVHALDDLCPHSGGPLSEGELVDGCVTCPWHGARFELATGRSVGEFLCRDVRRHDARVVDGVVEVELAAPRSTRA
jgi:nitrite reductase/ring-hydroxylating ferredoxin subunit